MQREAALIGANVQCLATGIGCSRSVVLALVKKTSGLLPAQRVVVELDAIHFAAVHSNDRRALRALKNRGVKVRKLLQVTDARIGPLHHILCLGELADGGDHSLPARRPVPGLRKNLQRIHVVVAVDDQPRQAVGFAEDQAVRIGIADGLLPIVHRFFQPLADQVEQVLFRTQQFA